MELLLNFFMCILLLNIERPRISRYYLVLCNEVVLPFREVVTIYSIFINELDRTLRDTLRDYSAGEQVERGIMKLFREGLLPGFIFSDLARNDLCGIALSPLIDVKGFIIERVVITVFT